MHNGLCTGKRSKALTRRFVLIAVAGWMNQQQQDAIDYLREENRILREQLGGRRLRLNDDQRRRLAGKDMMPSFAGRFTDAEMAALLAYLHTGLR